MAALRERGPGSSLDRVAELAGCPKASLARVFGSKEALFSLALRELGLRGLEALRAEAVRAGQGRQGALAAASLAPGMAMDSAFRGCPLNVAGAHLSSHPWAEPIVRAHKEAAVAFYRQLLLADMGGDEALTRARAICILSDGVHMAASAGMGHLCREAAVLALRALIEPL